jgi:hypothetical protein
MFCLFWCRVVLLSDSAKELSGIALARWIAWLVATGNNWWFAGRVDVLYWGYVGLYDKRAGQVFVL